MLLVLLHCACYYSTTLLLRLLHRTHTAWYSYCMQCVVLVSGSVSICIVPLDCYTTVRHSAPATCTEYIATVLCYMQYAVSYLIACDCQSTPRHTTQHSYHHLDSVLSGSRCSCTMTGMLLRHYATSSPSLSIGYCITTRSYYATVTTYLVCRPSSMCAICYMHYHSYQRNSAMQTMRQYCYQAIRPQCRYVCIRQLHHLCRHLHHTYQLCIIPLTIPCSTAYRHHTKCARSLCMSAGLCMVQGIAQQYGYVSVQ